MGSLLSKNKTNNKNTSQTVKYKSNISTNNNNNNNNNNSSSRGSGLLQIEVQPGPSGYKDSSKGESSNHPQSATLTTKTTTTATNKSPPESHNNSSESLSTLSCSSILNDDKLVSTRSSHKRKLSRVSLLSSTGSAISCQQDGGDDVSKPLNTHHRKQEQKNLSKLGATCFELSSPTFGDFGGVVETEQERLFREEQEKHEKESQQKRAKTARLKRRSELYGGSGARLSHGASGVKSAESVLRLIESNSTSRPSLIPSSSTTSSQPRVKNSFLACDNSVSRLVTEKQSLGIKTSALSRLKVTTQGNIDDFNFDFEAENKLLVNKSSSNNKNNNNGNDVEGVTEEPVSRTLKRPLRPSSHRGISRIRCDNEADIISRSAQYMRNLNNRMGSQTIKKISPLVTPSDLNQRAVQHSPSQGIRGQVSSWRLVPLHPFTENHTPPNNNNINNNNNSKYKNRRNSYNNTPNLTTSNQSSFFVNQHSRPPKETSPKANTANPRNTPITKLPACNSRNRAGLLLEGNLTMNKIEQFLETRDHIDKTEFDFVVRNLVEQQTTPPSVNAIDDGESTQNTTTANKSSSSRDHGPIFFPEFQAHQNQKKLQPETQKKKISHESTSGGFNSNSKGSTNNENRFVAAPYHPNQRHYYGKNKFFEPAAYANFPDVSSNSGTTTKHSEGMSRSITKGARSGGENRLLESLMSSSGAASSKSSLGSERSEKRGSPSVSSPYIATNNDRPIASDSLMATFHNTTSSFTGYGGAKSKNNISGSIKVQESFQGLPPVSSVALVTRSACINRNVDDEDSLTNGGGSFTNTPPSSLSKNDAAASEGNLQRICVHHVETNKCRRCYRSP